MSFYMGPDINGMMFCVETSKMACVGDHLLYEYYAGHCPLSVVYILNIHNILGVGSTSVISWLLSF